MIADVTRLLRSELEQFLRRKAHLGAAENIVRLTHFFSGEGGAGIPNSSLGMCLFNLDEERIMRTPGLVATRNGDRISYAQPEVRLNLYLLFAANFPEYTTGLRFIGWTIAFFQSRRVFSARNTPAMPPTISDLAVDIYAMTLEQQNYLWNILGAKYLPSVAYQVRPVLIQEGEIEFEAPPVQEIDLRTGSK
jgi:hypothetical protein